MKSLLQALQFAAFTLAEYARSGRILIEAAAAIGCVLIFFRPEGSLPATPEYFFSIAGAFTLALCFYSSSAIFGLGDRQQSYLLLVHGLGRTGYLIGLFAAIAGVVAAAYGLVCLVVAIINPIAGLDIRSWLLGTLPLVLNIALLAALLTLLAPMVLTASWRLLTLALVALAFSGSLISGPTMALLPGSIATIISVLRTIFSAPLLPAFTGFALSVSRDYSGISATVPFAQLGLTIALLGLAVTIFARRELILGNR
jgi:hypothetical protein